MGKMTQDAQIFTQMLEEDALKYDGFYSSKIVADKLEASCYMSKRMRRLLEYFSEVIIVDTSHKTNRFNLPLLDIALINNYGQTCMCYFSLMSNQKFDSFEWSLQKFKSQLKREPKVIFSDDEEALRAGNSLKMLVFFIY